MSATTLTLDDIDLVDRDTYVRGVPFDQFELLRREAPFFWHEHDPDGPGFWAVTRYADVVEINRDNERFSSAARTALINEMPDENLEQQRLLMLNMDPPMHTRYRLLVNKGFTPRMVGKLEEGLRARTRRIIQDCVDAGEADFVTDIAAELPLQAIADIMGVPQEDRHKVFDWSNRMIGSEDPEFASEDEEFAQQASAELYAYANALAAEKRANPSDDIISVLLKAEIEGDRLSELEFDLFFLLLAVAGNETTRNLISNGMVALFEHPDQWARLVADRSLLPTAVDEMLRWASPVMHFRRNATRDTEVGGHPIKEGDKVVIWYISANRDERQFPNPNTFDVGRTPNEHVAFGGGGPHFCLGANLARLEIRLLYETLLDVAPNIEQRGEPARLRSNFINGIKHLPVGFPS
jgi:cholest-4-en-3-one 26-monooxygenase